MFSESHLSYSFAIPLLKIPFVTRRRDEDKILEYNPAKNPKAENYPVSLKFLHCLDAPVVSYDVTKKFVERITKNGGVAYLRAFDKGGHEPQLVGEYIDDPLGNTRLGNSNIKIPRS